MLSLPCPPWVSLQLPVCILYNISYIWVFALWFHCTEELLCFCCVEGLLCFHCAEELLCFCCAEELLCFCYAKRLLCFCCAEGLLCFHCTKGLLCFCYAEGLLCFNSTTVKYTGHSALPLGGWCFIWRHENYTCKLLFLSERPISFVSSAVSGWYTRSWRTLRSLFYNLHL